MVLLKSFEKNQVTDEVTLLNEKEASKPEFTAIENSPDRSPEGVLPCNIFSPRLLPRRKNDSGKKLLKPPKQVQGRQVQNKFLKN